MSTGSQVKIAAPAAHTPVAKTASQQPPSVGALEAPVLAEQMERARLGHNFGAISVFPPDPPIQPKRVVEPGSRLGAFRSPSQSSANPAPVIPKGWALHPPIQAKLTVGQPNDPYEQEADRVADQVMRMAEPRVQAKCACGGEAGGDGECAACKAQRLSVQRQAQNGSVEEENIVQAKPETAPVEATPDLESRLNGSRGSGQALPEETRSSMESAFGADFGGVRVHTGSEAVQMNKELGAHAFTHGSNIYFNAGKYEPGSAEGKGLLAHELTHVVQQGREIVNKRIQLTRAGDLISTHTSWGNLDEGALGQVLIERIRTGEYNFIQDVLNELGGTDRDDVSYEFTSRLTNEQLDNICLYEPGRRLLDRLFDELTSGSVAEEEQRQADRIIDAKARTIPPSQFPTSLESIKVFPFRTPGMTVLNDAPMTAERRSNGRIWIKMPVRVLGTDQFRRETRTLPAQVFTSGLELPENEIIGVRLYDLGNVEPVFKPALFLVQLANETDTAIASTIGEVVGIGLTLGVGELVVLGVEASMAARVLLWADRAAFILGTLSTVINEHRGWILSAFGESGRTFLYYNSLVQRATAIYGMGRLVFALGSLLNNFRRSFLNWKVAADSVEEISTDQQRILRSIEQEGESLFEQTDEMQRARRGAGSTEDAPSGSRGATTEPDGSPSGSTGPRRLELPDELAGACVLGSINCRRLPQRILDEIEPYPETLGGYDVPFPAGEIRIMRSAISGVERDTLILRRVVLDNGPLWSPRFRAALQRAQSRGLDWPLDSFGHPWEVHHIKPVSMGGGNLPGNLLPLPRSIHQQYTAWWNSLLGRFRIRFSAEDWAALVHNEASVAGSSVPANPVR